MRRKQETGTKDTKERREDVEEDMVGGEQGRCGEGSMPREHTSWIPTQNQREAKPKNKNCPDKMGHVISLLWCTRAPHQAE